MNIPDQESRGHIIETKTYYKVFGALLALTALTVGASLVDWGHLILGRPTLVVNVVIALVIATAKAYLVLMYFMHMKHEGRFIWFYGIAYPLVIFSILMFFLILDVFNRNKPVPSTSMSAPTTISVAHKAPVSVPGR